MEINGRISMNDTETLIEVKNLIKHFKARGLLKKLEGGVKAIDGVSFSIKENTVFGLVGESGCGKTTMARTLLLLTPPTSGEIFYKGEPISSLSKKALKKYRRNMQIVFQDPNSSLNPKLKISTSMSEGLSNIGIKGEKQEKIIDKYLELVGISPKQKNQYPHEFSGGQKQRIVIARALTMNPEFLILDEPVSNLDVSIQAQIINLLMDLKEQFSLTYLFISHDLNLVAYLSDEIAVMYQGKIVESGETMEIINNPKHPYTIKLLNSIPGNTQKYQITIRTTDNQSKSDKNRDKTEVGCPYYNLCPIREDICTKQQPKLINIENKHAVACLLIEQNK